MIGRGGSRGVSRSGRRKAELLTTTAPVTLARPGTGPGVEMLLHGGPGLHVKFPRRKRTSNVTKLLFERGLHAPERSRAPLHSWSSEQWMRRPMETSAYFKLNVEAKSTIALAFSGDGEYCASTHGDHTVKVFKCATWELVCTLRGHERTPWTVKFHPRDNRVLASGSLDQTVRIWDLRSGRELRRQSFDFVVSCIGFHSSGELLAIAAGKRIFLWRWQLQSGHGGQFDPPPARRDGAGAAHVLMDGENAQRCVAFKRSVARAALCCRTNPAAARAAAADRPRRRTAPAAALHGEAVDVVAAAGRPPARPPARPAPPRARPPRRRPRRSLSLTASPAPADDGARPDGAPRRLELSVARSVMYSDAGFDKVVHDSPCELDRAPPPPPPRPGHAAPHPPAPTPRPPSPPPAHPAAAAAAAAGIPPARLFFAMTSRGQQCRLPRCQTARSSRRCTPPLTTSVLIGYGRCQAPPGPPSSPSTPCFAASNSGRSSGRRGRPAATELRRCRRPRSRSSRSIRRTSRTSRSSTRTPPPPRCSASCMPPRTGGSERSPTA